MKSFYTVEEGAEMQKAYSELKNKYMERFLQGCGLYDFAPSASYDILFCDSVDVHNKAIVAGKKVYLADHKLEYFSDVSKFEDFQYYIGFGADVYNHIYESFGFEPSKVIDGFVFNEAYETATQVDDIDILITAPNNQEYNIQAFAVTMLYYLDMINLIRSIVNPNVKVAHNIVGFRDITACLSEILPNRYRFSEIIAQAEGIVDHSAITDLQYFQAKTINKTVDLANNDALVHFNNSSDRFVVPDNIYSTVNGLEVGKDFYNVLNKERYVYKNSQGMFSANKNMVEIQNLHEYLKNTSTTVFPRHGYVNLDSKIWASFSAKNAINCNDALLATLGKI